METQDRKPYRKILLDIKQKNSKVEAAQQESAGSKTRKYPGKSGTARIYWR